MKNNTIININHEYKAIKVVICDKYVPGMTLILSSKLTENNNSKF